MRRLLSVPAVKAALPSRYKLAGRRAYLRVAGVVNAGSRVACPCCGKQMRKFARFHGLHDQCPTCGSLMRHRAMLLHLRDVLDIPQHGGSVLHVGPGPSLSHWLNSLGTVEYLSADINPAVADVQADITSMPFADNSFDYVICVHVLEHVPDDRTAMREMVRVLRPGGTAVIQVPPSDLEETFEDPDVTAPEDRERLFGQYDHVRVCGADYGGRLDEAGFDVVEEDYVTRLTAAERVQYALRVGEPFYVCVKPHTAT
jgi:SAM-dependent methyltransferase